MKCDKYLPLLEKFENNLLSPEEKAELNLHIKNCDSCRQAFSAIEKYKSLSLNLHKHKPKLANKELLIDQILNQLPDKEINISEINQKTIQIFPYKFRLAAASLAASLVLLFAVQQTMDALKIKQLENKFAYQQKPVDYTLIKASFIINLLNPKAETKFTGLLSKARKTLQIKTFAMFKNEYSLLTKSESKKTSNPGSVFYVDSIYHH
jgi:hypothetical protein